MLTNYLPILWLAAVVGLALLEAATYQLVAIWFAIGALAAMFCAYLGWLGFTGQVTVFVLLSTAALIATRPFLKKVLKVKQTPTNADQLIGQEAMVIRAITPLKKGRVHVSGLDWAAAADLDIPEGAIVEILSIQGATLKVKAK